MSLRENRIQKNLQKLQKIVRKTTKRSTPDQIHKLRAHIRRFEAACGALGLASNGNERRLLRDLSALRKRAGKIRDMDVLAGHLSEVPLDKNEKECRVMVLHYLGAKRYRRADKFYRLLKRARSQVRRRLKRTSKRVAKIGTQLGKKTSRHQNADVHAKDVALDISSKLQEPAVLTKTNLHPYRLQVKELRYMLQMAESTANKSIIAQLGDVKDAIGEWHDWDELVGVADKVLDHGNHCLLKRRLKSISQKKFRSALTLANRLRRQFSGRNGNLPLLKAVSDIAA